MSNTFVDGMMFKKPREGAPDFIKGNISVKVDDFVKFAKAHANEGWINIDLKKSKEGNLYLALNDYKKKDVAETMPPLEDEPEVKPNDFPF